MPRPVIVAVVLAVAAGALVLVVRARTPAPVPIEVTEATPEPTPPPLIVVDVEGAVARPGVVRLASGARVADAIAAAGGATADADPAALNKAAALRDGARVYVPRYGEIPPAGRWPITTLNVPPGHTMDLEFVADNPGDWPIHCHKNHHAMNAMSHDVPNMTGVDMSGVEKKVSGLLPGYMNMGKGGMYEMGDMQMPLPPNTLPMMAGAGPFGPIGMGGMFTIIKIRDGIETYEDPGWYQHPAGTVARKVAGPTTAPAAGAATRQTGGGGAVVYTCPMHEEIRANAPGRCPICTMTLVPAKK